MSKPRLVFTINANPDTLWRVRVVVHKTLNDLMAARVKAGGDGGEVLAFCDCYPVERAVADKDCVFCEIHLSEGDEMQSRYIAHECMHATLRYNFLVRLKLDGASDDIEEHAAVTLEHMFSGITWGLRHNKIYPR